MALTFAKVSALVVWSLGGVTQAGQFGAAKPLADEGKVSVGVGYFRFATELNPEKRNTLLRHQEIKQDQLYLQLTYGFLKDWEGYLRITASDLKLENAFPLAGSNGHPDTFADVVAK